MTSTNSNSWVTPTRFLCAVGAGLSYVLFVEFFRRRLFRSAVACRGCQDQKYLQSINKKPYCHECDHPAGSCSNSDVRLNEPSNDKEAYYRRSQQAAHYHGYDLNRPPARSKCSRRRTTQSAYNEYDEQSRSKRRSITNFNCPLTYGGKDDMKFIDECLKSYTGYSNEIGDNNKDSNRLDVRHQCSKIEDVDTTTDAIDYLRNSLESGKKFGPERIASKISLCNHEAISCFQVASRSVLEKHVESGKDEDHEDWNKVSSNKSSKQNLEKKIKSGLKKERTNKDKSGKTRKEVEEEEIRPIKTCGQKYEPDEELINEIYKEIDKMEDKAIKPTQIKVEDGDKNCLTNQNDTDVHASVNSDNKNRPTAEASNKGGLRQFHKTTNTDLKSTRTVETHAADDVIEDNRSIESGRLETGDGSADPRNWTASVVDRGTTHRPPNDAGEEEGDATDGDGLIGFFRKYIIVPLVGALVSATSYYVVRAFFVKESSRCELSYFCS